MSALSRLPPPSFAIVMATGILAVAARQQGLARPALLLFDVALFAWLLLGLLSFWRLARRPRDVLHDLGNHLRAPAFFTAVAGTGVLAGGLVVLDIDIGWAVLLGGVALLLWFVMTYGVLAAVITAEDKPTLDRGIGGAWLLSVVACQSVSVVAGLLSGHFPQPWRLQLNFMALCMWLFGGMLYTWVIGLIFYRALFFRFAPADLVPPYWINMGAMAISTLAGAQLVADAAEAPLLQALLPFVKGFTILYWATGTWWLPMLVVLTAWRYLLRRDPLRGDALDWSAVFPLGMYSASTFHLAHVADLGFLRPVAATFFWIAVAAWTATLVAKAGVVLSDPDRPRAVPRP
jgi:tellurite resistance protein TehA-like permease